MRWFYGFMLYIVINDKGEILNFANTQANVDDREPLKNENFLKAVFGKLLADKGYISEKIDPNIVCKRYTPNYQYLQQH